MAENLEAALQPNRPWIKDDKIRPGEPFDAWKARIMAQAKAGRALLALREEMAEVFLLLDDDCDPDDVCNPSWGSCAKHNDAAKRRVAVVAKLRAIGRES